MKVRMNMNHQKIENLPKWAQQRLRVAEMHLQESENRARTLFGQHDSPVSISWDFDHNIAVPRNSRLRVDLPDNHWIDVRKDDYFGLLLMADADMVIRPGSNNTIRVSSLYATDHPRVGATQ